MFVLDEKHMNNGFARIYAEPVADTEKPMSMETELVYYKAEAETIRQQRNVLIDENFALKRELATRDIISIGHQQDAERYLEMINSLKAKVKRLKAKLKNK